MLWVIRLLFNYTTHITACETDFDLLTKRGNSMFKAKCPYKHKYELVNWLMKFSNDNGIKTTRTRINKRSVKQLRWLYYNLPSIMSGR